MDQSRFVISTNKHPSIDEFHTLMYKTDQCLNDVANRDVNSFRKHTASQIEKDVCEALNYSAIDTPFENTIRLISGKSFPDIFADGLYGVEVKSTEKDHWVSTGSSIMESSRIKEIERIFLTFGKLGGTPIEFMSRPYEECMSEIRVTHSPRYSIDMRLKKGESVFDHMNVSYDELRNSDNQNQVVMAYLKKKCKDGEKPWYLSEEESSPAIIRLWSNLADLEKAALIGCGYAYFPELFSNRRTKYNRFTMWLVERKCIVCPNVRDAFSASGRVNIPNSHGVLINMPAVFGRIITYRRHIVQTILNTNNKDLEDMWQRPVLKNKLDQWCAIVASYTQSNLTENVIYDIVKTSIGDNI